MWVGRIEACCRVRNALDAADVPYSMVHHPSPRGRRDALQERSGQRVLPVIEFADGRIYREESRDMAARIKAGKLAEA